MRRDLDLDIDVTQIVLAPPDRSELREMFRRFEFRNLLNRIDVLDEALPAAEPARVPGTTVAWREAELPEKVTGRVGLAIVDDRFALATGDEVLVGPWNAALIRACATRRSSRTTSSRCRG